MTGCLRCYCISCDRDPAGDLHGHICTKGVDCLEVARNGMISMLRDRVAELELAQQRES